MFARALQLRALALIQPPAKPRLLEPVDQVRSSAGKAEAFGNQRLFDECLQVRQAQTTAERLQKP